jgi:hypothetical protein
MITFIVVCGGLFLVGFADFLIKPTATIRSYVSISALTSLLTVFDILIDLLVVSLLFSVFDAWTDIS